MSKFFKILRAGLWDETLDALTPAEALVSLQEAERQTVVGIVFDAINSCGVRLKSQQVLEYYSRCLKIEQQNALVNQELCALAHLLSENGIRYAVVKGQVAATCYGRPQLRQSGDIDFYCDAENFERAKALIVKEWGAEYKITENTSHIAFNHNGIEFEQHSRLAQFYNKKLDAYWNKVLSSDKGMVVSIQQLSVKTLSPTLHSFYIFIHLYKHLLGLGVGIRQFCDWAMMLHAYKERLDHEALCEYLSFFGLEKAYKACGCILVDKLGLPASDFSYVLTEQDRKYSVCILDIILYRGNMGHYNKRTVAGGWKHDLEAIGIKWSHFFKFFPLAPKFTSRWILHEMKRKIRNRL